MRIESVDVGESALTARIRFSSGEQARTDPRIASAVLALLPGLAKHRCDNSGGLSFPAEVRDTEIAHLLEHVASEIGTLAGSARTLRGVTAWDFSRDGPRVFRVTLQYDDDLVALGALKAAADVVSAVVEDRRPPDIDAIVERLRQLRAR